MSLTLASASPRRRALLASAGVEFELAAAHIDETPLPDEEPRAYARRVAREKGRAVPGGRVLAADTIVVLEGTIFPKPADPEAARATLRALSGATHLVHTAVHLRDGRRSWGRFVTTEVRFRVLTERDIDWYVATGACLDKAGAYGIQDDGALLVDRIRGSYTNVLGLPLRETLALLGGAP